MKPRKSATGHTFDLPQILSTCELSPQGLISKLQVEDHGMQDPLGHKNSLFGQS